MSEINSFAEQYAGGRPLKIISSARTASKPAATKTAPTPKAILRPAAKVTKATAKAKAKELIPGQITPKQAAELKARERREMLQRLESEMTKHIPARPSRPAPKPAAPAKAKPTRAQPAHDGLPSKSDLDRMMNLETPHAAVRRSNGCSWPFRSVEIEQSSLDGEDDSADRIGVRPARDGSRLS